MPATRASMSYHIRNQIADADGISAGKILEKEVRLTSAEILALNTTAKELVAAPGAGKVLEFVSMVSFLDYNSVDYATRGDLTVNLGTTGTAVSATIAKADLIQASADAYNVTQALSADVVLQDNEKLELRCATGDPDTGDSILIVKVMYRLHDFS